MDDFRERYIEIKENFVPVKESRTLKSIGFNEPCFGYYTSSKEFYYSPESVLLNSEFKKYTRYCSAPVYDQVFKWFREKHKVMFSFSDNSDFTVDFSIKYKNTLLIGKKNSQKDALIYVINETLKIIPKRKMEKFKSKVISK